MPAATSVEHEHKEAQPSQVRLNTLARRGKGFDHKTGSRR